MFEDEKNAVLVSSSVEKVGYWPVYFARLRSLYIMRNEKEPPDLKDQAAGVQKNEPRAAGR